MNLSTADFRNYWTEFYETWWSYRYMFLVDPKVFRFVVKGVKAIFLGAILKMATGRKFLMSGINSGHHYLPTYQIWMTSDNVEFLTPILKNFYRLPFSKWPPKYCKNSTLFDFKGSF
jgi:hypothetical protein